jgi:starch-binding outer membrane protein, SusD/RagB family
MRTTYVALALGALVLGACNLPDEANLNNPSANDFSVITDQPHLQALVTGVLRGDRVQNENEIIYGETIGRDGMRLTGSEPRFVTELLGPSSIDPSDFLGAALWPFATIRLANIGLHGVAGAPSTLLDTQGRPATEGFIQTIKALIYLRVIEVHDTTGAPINVDIDPTAPPAPLNCKNDVLAYIAALLDTAATNLAAGGSAFFPFAVPDGLAGFDTPASFRKFNRALAARVDVYLAFRGYAPLGTVVGTIDPVYLDSADADLAASFMNPASALDSGPAHTYSTGTGDATSGLWDQGLAKTAFRANPRVVSEADAGDQRVARKLVTGSSIAVQGFASDQVFTLYPDATTPTPIITNKELLLLQAEVNWARGNYATALAEADAIRSKDGGLTTDTTTAVAAGVLNRILYEKRYSLLWESPSRWVDARMFGKLNASAPPTGVGVEQEPAPGQPYRNFPIPFNEAAARNNDLSKQACALP